MKLNGKLSREFRDHVDQVNNDGNNYFSNPNYYQEKYDLIDEYLGLDTESAVRFIVEHDIYTEAIVKYLDNYEAFRYIKENAPYVEKIKAEKYALRIFSAEPESLKGLETGLYLALMADTEDDDAKSQTIYLSVLKHHPNSVSALYGLARVFLDNDAPEEALPLLQKGKRLVPSLFNLELGLTYDRLGDYKTAWIYFRKELKMRKSRSRANRHIRMYEREHMSPGYPISTSPIDSVVNVV